MKQQYFRITLFAALMATLAIGCQKEEGTVTLGAEIQKPADSKMYIDDHTPCWHNGDEVHINSDDYPVMAATGSSARIEDVVSASAYRAIFPARIVAENADISSMSSFPVTLPSTQLYELVGSHQLVDVPMGAYLTSGSTLQFHNLCSVVRVIVSNSLNRELPLRSIELQAQSAKLSGTGTATVSGQQADCITLSGSGQNRVSLVFDNDCPATVEARGTSTFDIVVPAFTTDDVTITAYTADGYLSTVTKEDVALVHNTITTVTLNVTALAEAPHAELVTGSAFNAAIPAEATSVVFEYNSSVTSGTLLSTANSPVPIYGNLDGTVWRISTSDSLINANSNSSYMFYRTTSSSLRLNTIDFGSGFNTANVTDMNNMFGDCNSLTSLDLSNFNTANVTNMNNMFAGCSNLTSLNLSSFNTANVTNMRSMFSDCRRLTSLDLSNFNTANVTNMLAMFGGCSIMTNLNLSNFNTTNVTNMGWMFWGCNSMTSLNLSNFNTANVKNMSLMFYNCSSLTSLNLSNFNTANVTNMSDMFRECSSLTSLNLSNFNTENVTNMGVMFYNCSSLTSLNLSNFNTANVTDMSEMFYGCSSLTSLNLSNFNTANVTNMSSMFHNCSSLTSMNLSNFNTANVTNMSSIFHNCSSLTSMNLSNFNTANVTNMSSMFHNCSSLTSLNLSNFNTANVTNMRFMFHNCSSLTSLNLSSFYTTSVNNMQAMFMNCRSLTNLNLAHFDMSHLTSHDYYGVTPYQRLSGKYDMCNGLSTTSHNCTITCPLVVQTEIQAGTGLPTSDVTFTWVRP